MIESSVQASTLWFAIVSASAMPTAASPPSVSPRALVSADAICDALIVTLPVNVSASPVDRYAFVVTFEIAMPTAGATATSSADAPVFASVVDEVASSTR